MITDQCGIRPVADQVAQVKDLKPGDEIEIKEKKTGKLRRITLSKAAVTAIQAALKATAYADGNYLFKSAKGPVLTVPSRANWLMRMAP